jgi:endogenous inhibitor of DNA gyrase (YacG/DUF329 family)
VWEDNPDRPFCSERCRLIDLGKWSSEEFVVPGNAVEPDALVRDDAEEPE